jgi:hypothetical protein
VPAGFETVFPPDDTGRTTYERFRYQAHIAFRFCLEAATGGDVVAVVCEHFEDVAVERSHGWRLIQIKTRDAELPPWKLGDLLGKGGALRGLYRTHKALNDLNGGTHDCGLEARLEGAVARGDQAETLTFQGDGPTSEVVDRCAQRLDITAAEAADFLSKVTVIDHEPPRELIAAVMRDLLRRAAPGLSGVQVDSIYQTVFSKIEDAMEGRLLADQFPAVLVQPTTAEEAAQKLVEAKRLDRDTLVDLFGELTASKALLAQIADPSLLTATALERKLRLAGAEDAVVEDAKTLRANAAIREAEVLSASYSDQEAVLGDVRARLKIVANSIAATAGDPRGPTVWAGVMNRLATEAQSVDQSRLFDADQMLLLGELCQISDLCDFGWGGDA